MSGFERSLKRFDRFFRDFEGLEHRTCEPLWLELGLEVLVVWFGPGVQLSRIFDLGNLRF